MDWLSVTPTSGTLLRETQTDPRLNVTIDRSKVPACFNNTVVVGIRSTPARFPYFDQIRILVLNNRIDYDAAALMTGVFPETGGLISIESPHFQASSGPKQPWFESIPHLGSRSESGSMTLRPFDVARASVPNAKSALASYGIYLFVEAQRPLEPTVYINASLDTDPQLKMAFSLTLDDAPGNFTRVLGDCVRNPNAGDIPSEWIDQVADNVWTKRVRLGRAGAGAHRLVWRTNSPEVYLEKVVVDVGGGSFRDSYLGPPETFQFV